jgi:hypothetical protein
MKGILSEFKEFFQTNTPEFALGGSLVTDAGGFFSQALTAQQAVLAAIGAIALYTFQEQASDAKVKVALAAAVASNPTSADSIVAAAK